MKACLKDPPDLCGDDLALCVRQVNGVLRAQTDKSPRNPVINHTLTHFFAHAMREAEQSGTAESDALIGGFETDFLSDFHANLGRSETAMESYWAAKIAAIPNASFDDLRCFIYWKNYEALVNKEMDLLRAHHVTQRGTACFIGHGPLPMTMLLYRHLSGLPCVGVDHSLQATHDAQRLTKAVGLEDCRYVSCAGQNFDYAECDVIFVAAMTDDKDAVIEKIKRDRAGKETHVMVRTAERLSRLFYASYECALPGATCLGKTPYDTTTINTGVLYRV